MSKTFRPMKGEAIESLDDVRFPCYGSPKIDGYRSTVHGGSLMSSRMKKFPNQLANARFGNPKHHGLDGELVAGEPTALDVFNLTGRVLKNITHEREEDLKFYVFDYFQMKEYPYRDRLDFLKRMDFPPHIILLEQVLLKNRREAEVYEDRMVKLGYEGVMFRSLDGKYKWGRCSVLDGGLVKWKRFVDGEGQVLRVEEQMENTNPQVVNELGLRKRSSKKAGKIPAGTLGSIICWDLKYKCEVSVGNGIGWTDEERLRLWRIRKQLPGRFLRYRYQLVGVKDRPRFGRATGWREDFDVEES